MAKITAETIESVMTVAMTKSLPEIMTQIVSRFENCLSKLLASFENKMKDNIDIMNSEVYGTNVRIDGLERKLADAEKVIDGYRAEQVALRREIAAMEQKLDDQEQYNKRDNLVFHGIKESPHEDTTVKVIEVCRQYFPAVNIQPVDISISHRLPTKYERSDKAKPIIVRFARREVRQQVFQSKRHLKNSNIMIVEQLTNKRLNLVMTANTLLREGKLAGTWTSDGKVFVKLLDGTIKGISNGTELTGL